MDQLKLNTTPSEVLDRLREMTSETEINVLREKATGFDRICGLLFLAQLCHKPCDPDPGAPDREGPASNPVPTEPEPAATPVPADDPAPKPRRGRPPRTRATEDAPSLLPAVQSTPEPEPAPEAPSEPQGETVPVSPIIEDDGVPW